MNLSHFILVQTKIFSAPFNNMRIIKHKICIKNTKATSSFENIQIKNLEIKCNFLLLRNF